MIMADEQKPDRQDRQQQEQQEENDDEQQQKEQDKEESPQSPPSKVARVSSDESSAAAGAVTTAVASPLVLGLGLGVAAAGEEGNPPGFTFMQMQEFHHQALIFKHMVAGIPVPIHLVLPIWKSVAASYGPHHYPSFVGLGNLCSDFRNSMEPEPGRCRRTDGKKWRCSRDVVPDQKYCERHMHRGRNRSRKPVETNTQQTTALSSSSSSSSSSTLTALAPSTGSASSGSFQNFPLLSVGAAGSSQLHMDASSFGLGTRDFRYPYGVKAETDERSFFSEGSGSARGLSMDSSLDITWRLMPSPVSSYPISKESSGSLLQSNYPQLHPLQDIGQVTISSLPKPQHQQHSFFGSEFCSSEPVKPEGQSLRPFFDEWPKARDSWSDLDDDRSNHTSLSTTQLSMSIPMASSDFSTTTSRSPNDD